jgi:hypothetical protein
MNFVHTLVAVLGKKRERERKEIDVHIQIDSGGS